MRESEGVKRGSHTAGGRCQGEGGKQEGWVIGVTPATMSKITRRGGRWGGGGEGAVWQGGKGVVEVRGYVLGSKREVEVIRERQGEWRVRGCQGLCSKKAE